MKRNIRFYNIIDGVAANYPIVSAQSIQRSWLQQPHQQYKQLTKDLHTKKCPFTQRIGNIAKCPGIRSMMNTGWILPTPTDIRVVTDSNHQSPIVNIAATDSPIQFSLHPPELFSQYHSTPHSSLSSIFKFDFGWRVQAPKDIVFLITHVHYNNEVRFTHTTGILDPQESSSLNVQFFWHVLDGVTLIPVGTPMMQIIPMKRSLEYNVVVDEEYSLNDIQMLRNETFKLQSTFY